MQVPTYWKLLENQGWILSLLLFPALILWYLQEEAVAASAPSLGWEEGYNFAMTFSCLAKGSPQAELFKGQW